MSQITTTAAMSRKKRYQLVRAELDDIQYESFVCVHCLTRLMVPKYIDQEVKDSLSVEFKNIHYDLHAEDLNSSHVII